MDIDAYSITLTVARLGRRGGGEGGFFENRERFPDFGKKDPDCVHL